MSIFTISAPKKKIKNIQHVKFIFKAETLQASFELNWINCLARLETTFQTKEEDRTIPQFKSRSNKS